MEQSAPALRLIHGLSAPPGLLQRRARAGAAGQPQQPEPRAARQHRRQPGQAVVALWRHARRHRADRVSRAARSQRRLARRSLRGRSLVDAMAAILPRHAAAGLHPLAAKVRARALKALPLFSSFPGSGDPEAQRLAGAAQWSGGQVIDPRFRGVDETLRENEMEQSVGTGDFKYRIIENWAKLPDCWSFKEVAAVGVDD